MRVTSIIAGAILLTSCSTPQQHKQQALMDQIESEAKLPKGAMPLRDYARFYADAGKGQVIAVFMPPPLIEKAAAGECEQLTDVNGGSKRVPCVADEVRNVKAGERRWLPQEKLPFEVAPGCQVITLAFDTIHQRFEELDCVGNRPVRY